MRRSSEYFHGQRTARCSPYSCSSYLMPTGSVRCCASAITSHSCGPARWRCSRAAPIAIDSCAACSCGASARGPRAPPLRQAVTAWPAPALARQPWRASAVTSSAAHGARALHANLPKPVTGMSSTRRPRRWATAPAAPRAAAPGSHRPAAPAGAGDANVHAPAPSCECSFVPAPNPSAASEVKPLTRSGLLAQQVDEVLLQLRRAGEGQQAVVTVSGCVHLVSPRRSGGTGSGSSTSVSAVELTRPPITTMASGFWISEPGPVANSSGTRPKAVMLAVISTGPQPAHRAFAHHFVERHVRGRSSWLK